MNRIEIQVILLILQLETDYFSSYSFQKCSIQSSGTTVFTETSRTAILHEEVLQDSSAPILQGYPHTTSIHMQHTCSREFSIQNPILHAEDRELFKYYYYNYIQKAKRPSFQKRNSTHRRQGDLLEMHPCVLQDLPRTFQRHSQPQDLPKAFQSFQSFLTLQRYSGHSSHSWPSSLSRQFYKFQYLQGIHPIPAFSDQNAYSTYSTVRLVSTEKLHRVPVEQYELQTFILQRKGDVVISVKCASVKMSRWHILQNRIISSNVLSSRVANYKNDIQ